ncbi:MAG: hypothetical protein AAGC99_08095, partial [Pseudomonadota bacterium]
TAVAWERIGLRVAQHFAGALVMRAQKQIYAAPLDQAQVAKKPPSYAHLSPVRPAVAAERRGVTTSDTSTHRR